MEGFVHPSGSKVLGNYSEEFMKIKISTGQLLPIVVSKQKVKIRKFKLKKKLTISEAYEELDKVKRKFMENGDHLLHSFQSVVHFENIGWRSGYIVNPTLNKPFLYFANKYTSMNPEENETPYDALIDEIQITLYGYDEKYDSVYENLDFDE